MTKSIKNYLGLCFLITYITWGAVAAYSQFFKVNFSEYTWMYVLYIVGVLGPAISAIYISIKTQRYTFKKVLVHICQKPKNRSDWLLWLIISIIFSTIPFVVFGGKKLGSFTDLLVYIPMFLIIGGLEEVGWRGFWLEHIITDTNWSKIKGVFVIGIVWELWHLPLFFMIGSYQQQYLNIGIHTLWTLALSFALGALYIRSRSTILCIFSHCIINSIGNILVVEVSWYEAIIKLVICVGFFFLITYGFTKKEKSRQISISGFSDFPLQQ